jgi:4-hydroxy-2-oxoheptanedioate aldolase
LTYGDDYTDWVNDQLFVAVQIESVQAVENAEAIMAVPGIDGCMIGPADLACSMGFHPREAPKREEHNRMLERVVQACRSTGKIPGIDIGMPDTIAKRVEQGFLFIPMGSDVRFLNASAAAGIKLAQEAAAKLKVER